MSDFYSALLGVLAGILTGSALEWWKASRDNLSSSCGAFCDLIGSAADLGARFWLTAGSNSDQEALLRLAKLSGFQTLISGYLELLDDRLHDAGFVSISEALAHFFKALTGYNSDDPTRLPSKEAAVRVQTAAASVILTVRRAAYERFSLKKTILRIFSTSPMRSIHWGFSNDNL